MGEQLRYGIKAQLALPISFDPDLHLPPSSLSSSLILVKPCLEPHPLLKLIKHQWLRH